MKTILVIYADNAAALENGYMKRYSFNTESDVEVGDVLKSSNYDTKLVVAKILDKEYKYFDKGTGRLTNEIDAANCFEIKKLKVLDKEEEDIVIARKISE